MTHHALLLTDVVDSTRLTQAHGDARMAEVWQAHDRCVRDLLHRFRGREADRTDGFLLIFPEVADAAGFAGAFHEQMQALSARFALPFTARVAIHQGSTILLEATAADRARGAKPLEVEGRAKALVMQILDVAGGGWTVLTEAARSDLPERELSSLGHWQGPGLDHPLELFALHRGEAPHGTPSTLHPVVRQGALWVPARPVPHNLPPERDAFLGRERELGELDRLLQQARLVTVTGPGGIGKTRLATRFGWTRLARWPGGVHHCEPGDAHDPLDIASALARALDLALGDADPVRQLGHALVGRGPTLILLDAFAAAAPRQTLGRWLDLAPEARFLVTARAPLKLPGERTLPLGPLDPPAAVALFLARAGSGAEAPEARQAVEDLVQRLDGLPLGIELAASRLGGLTLQALGAQVRQAGGEDPVAWTWDLLGEDEQAALAQLSVFEGELSLEAADAVLDLPTLWSLDAMQMLVDRALVRRVGDDGYTLLPTIKRYAAARLDQRGERAETEARHGRHYALLGTEEALAALHGPEGEARLQVLERAHPNLLAASRRAAARRDGEVAGRTALAAWAVMELRGPLRTARELLGEALHVAPERSRLWAAVQLALGLACAQVGERDEAQARLEEVVALAREAGFALLLGEAWTRLGWLHTQTGQLDRAGAVLEQALAQHRREGHRAGEGVALHYLAYVSRLQGRSSEARARCEAALAIHREVGARRMEGRLLSYLGMVCRSEDPEAARGHLQAALAIHRQTRNRRSEGVALGNLGIVCLALGRMGEAETCFREAVTLHREVGARPFEGLALGNLAAVLQLEGRAEEALAAYRSALAIHQETGRRDSAAHVQINLGSLLRELGRYEEAGERLEMALRYAQENGRPWLQGAAEIERGALALAEGRSADGLAILQRAEALLRGAESRLALGKLLALRAGSEAQRESEARRDLEEAEALAETLGAEPELARLLARARARLG